MVTMPVQAAGMGGARSRGLYGHHGAIAATGAGSFDDRWLDVMGEVTFCAFADSCPALMNSLKGQHITRSP